jgi:hypothetical protein
MKLNKLFTDWILWRVEMDFIDHNKRQPQLRPEEQ